MQSSKRVLADIAGKLQECLSELGFEPESRVSEHEGIVSAKKEIQGACIRVVLHVSDREGRAAGTGSVGAEIARARLTQAAIRPSLAAQVSSRLAPEQGEKDEECK